MHRYMVTRFLIDRAEIWVLSDKNEAGQYGKTTLTILNKRF